MDQIESCVPPGFRFHPTEEELVGFYLKKKVNSLKFDIDVINDIDLYRMEPWDIQDKCKLGYDEQNEWYFFSYKDRKYPTGTRTNRATRAGFWKATGRDKAVLSKNNIIGMRKTLVFYKGRAPNGNKSDWIMHEYRLQTSEHAPPQEEGWVVCRAFKKPTPSHAKQGLGAWNHPNGNYYYMRENTYNNNHHARSIANMSSPTNNINQLTDHNTNSYHPHQQQAMQPFGNFEQELISTNNNNNNNNNSAIDLIENQFLIDLPRLDSPSLSPSLATTKEASDHHQQDGGVINHKDYDIEKSNGKNNNNNNNKWEILDCFLASQIPHETQASFFYSNPQSLRLVPCDYELEAHNQEANFLGSCFHNL